MRQRTFSLVVATVCLLISVAHLVRVVLGSTVVVAGAAIPMWPSVLAVVLMGYLSFEGFRLARKPKSAP